MLCTFKNVRTRPVKKHFDEISSDERLQDKIVDVALGQLDQRFVGQSLVNQMFAFIQPWNSIKYSNKQLSAHVDKFLKVYGRGICEDPDMRTDVESEIRQFTRYFKEDIAEM